MDKFPLSKNIGAEQKLHALGEAARLQEAIINAAEVSIISTDTKGIITSFNRAAENLLGYSADEVIGKTTLVMLHDGIELIERASALSEELGVDVDPNFEALSFKAQLLKSADRDEWTYIHKNGNRVPVQLSITGLWDENDKLIGYAGIATDMSEQRKIQIQIRKSEAHLNALVSSLDDIVFEIDDDGRFLNVWAKNDDDLFFPRTKILGRSFREVFGDDFGKILDDIRIRVMTTYQPESYDYKSIVTGSDRWFSAKFAMIYENGKPTKRLTIRVEDITFKKEAETKIIKSEQKFRSLTENIPGVIYLRNNDENFSMVYLNLRVEELTGFAAEEFLTQKINFNDLYHPNDRERIRIALGLLSGLIAGWAYNRYSDMRLPSYLAFFGGRRFVPIVCGFTGLLLGLGFGVAWPVVEHGMDTTSQAVLGSESVGLFAYGVLNRVLIVTGLHHIINNIAWFLLGDYNGVTGDLKRFFAGDPSAGAFMSGFFPVMMFGLPGACLAMYRTAHPAKRKAVGGMLLSMGLTSFLTGVTEPIEFSFMFLAPLLYAIHALLTGIAMALMDAIGVHLGFGFSAGLFDYVLNYSLSTRPLLLIPVGLAYFALYYGLFKFFIVRFDLKTLGREADEAAAPRAEPAGGAAPAYAWINALGSASNLLSVEACATRLRLVVADSARIDERELKALGAHGVLRLADGALQVVVGPVADQLASEIRDGLKIGAARQSPPSAPLSGRGVRIARRRTRPSSRRRCARSAAAANIVELQPRLEPAVSSRCVIRRRWTRRRWRRRCVPWRGRHRGNSTWCWDPRPHPGSPR